MNPWDYQTNRVMSEDGIAATVSRGSEVSGNVTQSVLQQNFHATVYGISPYASNCMKSENPHSGYYEASTSRTLDNNGGNPCCNQGGMVVLEGNGSRASHKGDGYKESETMFTLNTVEQHGVCYGLDRASFNQGENAKYDFSIQEDKAQTIVSRGPGGVMTLSDRCVQETRKE